MEKDGKCGMIDFSLVTPAAESYCAEAAKTLFYAATLREEAKTLKYFQAYKQLDDIQFEPFVVESRGSMKYSRNSAILSPIQRDKVDPHSKAISGSRDSLSPLRKLRTPSTQIGNGTQ